MTVKRGRRFKNRQESASTPAWLQPLPSGPVRFDLTLRTARQLLEETSVRLYPSFTVDETTSVPRRAA